MKITAIVGVRPQFVRAVTKECLITVLDLLRKEPPRPVVLPLHRRTREAATRFGLNFDGLMVARHSFFVRLT